MLLLPQGMQRTMSGLPLEGLASPRSKRRSKADELRKQADKIKSKCEQKSKLHEAALRCSELTAAGIKC